MGKTLVVYVPLCIVDHVVLLGFVGDLIGIPNLPAFANPSATGKNILRGVNYASAAAGILDETGQNLVRFPIYFYKNFKSISFASFGYYIYCYDLVMIDDRRCCLQGQRFSLSQQVENFEKTLNQLRNNMNMSDEEISHYLSKALVVMTLGSNDYINNYLVPSMYPTSFMYNPKDYADLLIERYARQILVRLDRIFVDNSFFSVGAYQGFNRDIRKHNGRYAT